MPRSSGLRATLPAILLSAAFAAPASAGPPVSIVAPMPPPSWAVLERALIRANAQACQAYFHHYFDDRGYLECVTRWGGDDGPDDAIENLSDWPILHALGAPEEVLRLYKKGWEGHLRQFTEARTTDVPFAKDGMYYKEFPVMFDWLHHGEGLTPFNLQGLCDPGDHRFQRRTIRFAGFYLNEDPGAPNYDPDHKIIRSLINGSRGPMLRKATGLDWAGDPIEVENRFRPRHGESSYAQMVEHFRDYNDVAGDHPQNLLATTLALNAFALTGEPRYRDWLLGYVDAWSRRAADNGGILPSNVGLDGKAGSAAGGKWYGGVYGWGFTVHDPGSGRMANRNTTHLGIVGFGNAYLLTGDDRYLDVWRKQTDAVNANKKVVDGQTVYPTMHGDQGWYGFTPAPYSHGAAEIYYWSMRPEDRERLPQGGRAWFTYLEGNDPGYPERALRADFARLRKKLQDMRDDPTTPDTRLADDPLGNNPATTDALIELTLGGLHPGHRGAPLHCRVRYFDPEARRAGLPEDVAALVETLSADSTTLTLVNVDQVEPRTVVIQAGAYAEHQIVGLQNDGASVAIDAPRVTVRLAPGAGGRLVLKMRRYANPPTMAQPWD
ncbi:MAG: hypothetical protein AB7I30_19140 [Isosphaeraceae bacterium]